MKKHFFVTLFFLFFVHFGFTQKIKINDGNSKYNYFYFDGDGNFNAKYNVNQIEIPKNGLSKLILQNNGFYSKTINTKDIESKQQVDINLDEYVHKNFCGLQIKMDKFRFNIKAGTKFMKVNEKSLKGFDAYVFNSSDFEMFLSDAVPTIQNALEEEGILEKSTNMYEKEKEYRYCIGLQINDYRLVIAETKTTSGSMKCFYISYILGEWQIFDNKTKELVFDKEISSISETDGSLQEMYITLREALYSNIRNLGKNKEFVTFIENEKGSHTANSSITPLKLKKLNNTGYSSNQTMIKASLQSLVTIKTNLGHGSGFFISADGYILTNNHVIEDSKSIEVVLPEGMSLKATVVSNDIENDLAVLKVDGSGYSAFEFETNPSSVGDEIYVLGTPEDLKLEQTVTKGVVSANRKIGALGYVQTDASVNPGNSGGPIINTKGKVIAITTLKRKNSEGIALGIDIKSALEKLQITFD